MNNSSFLATLVWWRLERRDTQVRKSRIVRDVLPLSLPIDQRSSSSMHRRHLPSRLPEPQVCVYPRNERTRCPMVHRDHPLRFSFPPRLDTVAVISVTVVNTELTQPLRLSCAMLSHHCTYRLNHQLAGNFTRYFRHYPGETVDGLSLTLFNESHTLGTFLRKSMVSSNISLSGSHSATRGIHFQEFYYIVVLHAGSNLELIEDWAPTPRNSDHFAWTRMDVILASLLMHHEPTRHKNNLIFRPSVSPRDEQCPMETLFPLTTSLGLLG